MSGFPQPRSAYIHVPFCAHRCGYCDFTLIARRDDLMGAYLDGLARQLESLGNPVEVDTVFFGGGTPTHLDPPSLARLLELTNRWFRLVPGGEFSVEANPSGLTDEKLDLLAETGVNRVSLGVQSFVNDELRLLERDHAVTEAVETVGRLQRRFRNVSLDLIFALPGQTLETWKANLERAIELQPQHLSTYGLTFERGTTFWSKQSRGTIVPAEQELERQMYEHAMDRLEEAGYGHYEVSNFARPGFECRHNQTYWRADSFYGFGPGAASFVGGVRRMNHRSVTTWIRKVLAGESPIVEEEVLTPEERAREAVMVGLRQAVGLNVAEFQSRYGFELLPLGGEAAPRFLQKGWLEIVDGSLRLTRSGRLFTDTVVMEFL
ncbi:radical SAM family heme chaperone HemW [Planctomyces sp. SH-PL14]|uniref:radical SAM family heme chaperone HemW n=1 Tax=Planctomyces sp. SH-PL14 TaxID=1632864 RepID=UPI00078BE3EE|nr:radical SAM family heme chaperone HemW [Planctomyces sp. SH-PL14]AMV22013.1 Oxygen-independent coproporphyrinogen-III oxidase 1 [Planctomyces sp. SH-PL14]